MPDHTLNDWEKAYIAELRTALQERTDLTQEERRLLKHEVIHIEKGIVRLTGPDTVEERIERLRNHYP